MTPKELEALRLILASGAPIGVADVAPDCTIRDVAEAMQGVDVCFRDYGVGVIETRAVSDEGVVGELEVAASVEVPDRAGDLVQLRRSTRERVIWDPMLGEQVVTPFGFNVDNFMRAAGPVLWAHNRDEQLPPVGSVTRSRIQKIDTPNHGRRNALVQTVALRPDEDLPISQTIARLAMQGSLRTFSVGFAKVHVDFVRDDNERAKLGLGPYGVVFASSDQAELSFTPTPMNPLAVTLGAKDAEALVARDVSLGLKRLREEGFLTRSQHDAVHDLLVPLSGDARAAEKVRAFVDFGECVRRTGLWPGMDDLDDEQRSAARAAVAVRPARTGDASVSRSSEDDEPSVDEPAGAAVTHDEPAATQDSAPAPETQESAPLAAESDPAEPDPIDPDAPDAPGDPSADQEAETIAGLRRLLTAEREANERLRAEVAAARQEVQEARDAASSISAGLLTQREHDTLWAVYEGIANVEGLVGELAESLASRVAPAHRSSENDGQRADGAGSFGGEVERVLGPLVERLLAQRLEGRDAPASAPGDTTPPTSGDRLEVGDDGAAAIRLSREIQAAVGD